MSVFFLDSMLPRFTENGFLPQGIWECSIEEFISRFAIFQKTDRRVLLFSKLENLLSEISRINLIKDILIDGSYVTNQIEPNDIDIIIVLDRQSESIEIPFWVLNTLDSNLLRKKYQFDVKVVIDGSHTYFEYLDFFQNVRQSNLRKGLVRLIR